MNARAGPRQGEVRSFVSRKLGTSTGAITFSLRMIIVAAMLVPGISISGRGPVVDRKADGSRRQVVERGRWTPSGQVAGRETSRLADQMVSHGQIGSRRGGRVRAQVSEPAGELRSGRFWA